jgi:hypothetical protein
VPHGGAVSGSVWVLAQVEKYDYLPGMQELLQKLKKKGYEMHVVSNYPSWYQLIEDKLAVRCHRNSGKLRCVECEDVLQKVACGT